MDTCRNCHSQKLNKRGVCLICGVLSQQVSQINEENGLFSGNPRIASHALREKKQKQAKKQSSADQGERSWVEELEAFSRFVKKAAEGFAATLDQKKGVFFIENIKKLFFMVLEDWKLTGKPLKASFIPKKQYKRNKPVDIGFLASVSDVRGLIPAFFDGIKPRIDDYSLDQLLSSYFRVICLGARPSHSRSASITPKTLQFMLKTRGFMLITGFFGLEPLKTLLFIHDTLFLAYNLPKTGLLTPESLSLSSKTLPRTPFILEIEAALARIACESRPKCPEPPHFDPILFPILAYFALLASKTPVFLKEVHEYLETGRILYLDPRFSSNIPSISYLRSLVSGFYQRYKPKISLISRTNRLLDPLGLENQAEMAVLLEKLLEKAEITANDEVAHAAGVVFLMKMAYGLNNEAYMALFNDEIELKGAEKSKEIRDKFVKTSGMLRFLRDMPGLDGVLGRIRGKTRGFQAEKRVLLEKNSDLGTAGLESFDFVAERLENSDFPDLQPKLTGFEAEIRGNIEVLASKTVENKGDIAEMGTNVLKKAEKRGISRFLMEEVGFLAGITPETAKNTVFPMPSARYMLVNAGTVPEKPEISLFLDFYAGMLGASPLEIHCELAKIEKKAISGVF